MAVHFSVDFNCQSCGAGITYEDEAPNIQKDRTRVIENNKLYRWRSENNALVTDSRVQVNVLRPQLEKYILCNVCGERIYFA